MKPSMHVRDAIEQDLPLLADWLGRRIDTPRTPHERLLLVESDDPATGPLATLRLRPAIGLDLPRVSYHVGCTVHAAPELGLFHRQRTLLLGHDHTGASELADIAWNPRELPLADTARALHTLVHAALRLVTQARQHYAQRLVAELPGPRDAAGQSPFWQGLGRHFYSGDPAAAAALHGPAWRSHAAALLPRHLLYTSFLPAAAEAAIAQVAEAALVLREVLEDAGLRYAHHINVEDGGPVLEVDLDDLQARRQAQGQGS
jgi:arginine N-succinyltransferase